MLLVGSRPVVGVAFAAMTDEKARLRTDLTTAMKARDALTTGTLRMLLAAVQAEEVAGKAARELSDDEVLKVYAKEAKKRAEAASLFDDAGRSELADKERAEGEIIAAYLPTPLDDAAVAGLVDEAIAEVQAQTGDAPGMRQMGQVMKAATARAGGGADGNRISAIVRAKLAE